MVRPDEARQLQRGSSVGRSQRDDLGTGVRYANDGVDELAFHEHPALNLETQPDEKRHHRVEVRDRNADVVEANTRHGCPPALVGTARSRGFVCLGSRPWLQRFLPPTPGTDVTCFIHAAIWRSSMSSMDSSSTPRVDLPIPTGVTCGTGSSPPPFTNLPLTSPANPPHPTHHPSPTP